jgi:pimeloyl-ACP methyl ester carboxylesterase
MLSRSTELPEGVDRVLTRTSRGEFAALTAAPAGPTTGLLLLVPGFTGSKEDFTPLLPLLAESGWLAVAYDQRGQYETPGGPDADFSLEALAADAHAVAEAVRTPGPTHLVGHSLGGLVAQAAAVHDPNGWDVVTLLCSGPGGVADAPDKRRYLTRLRELLAELPMDTVQQMREAQDRANGAPEPPPDIAAFLRRRFVASSAAGMSAFAGHLLEAPDIVDRVAATGLPVSVVRGAEDNAWAHTAQADMAARLGTQVVVVEDAAHSPAIENPTALAAVLIAAR